MKYETVLQTAYAAGGNWNYYEHGGKGYPGGFANTVYDSFGPFWFPKPDTVGAGRRLHVRFDKPERPNFIEINSWPRAKEAKGGSSSTR
jgi:hypothetical protein